MPKQPRNILYHANYVTGNPDVCFGIDRGCEIPVNEHFRSREEAERDFESYMEDRSEWPVFSKSKSSHASLNDDWEDYIKADI